MREDLTNHSRDPEECRAAAECKVTLEPAYAQAVREAAEMTTADADRSALKAELTEANAQAALQQQRIEELETHQKDRHTNLDEARSEAACLQRAYADLKAKLDQLQEHADGELETVSEEAASQRAACEALQIELDEHKAMIEDLRADAEDVEGLKRALHKLDDAMALADERAKLAEDKLEKRYVELAYLTNALLGAEGRLERSEEALNWLLEVNRVLMSSTPWWWNFMSKRWRRKRELRQLARRRLFDSTAYALQYPDVGQAGIDPLRHYMFHGLHEVIAGTR